MSLEQYAALLSKRKVIGQGEQAEMVKHVGTRIEHAVEQYFPDHGLTSRLAGYKWEYHLVEDKQINAWCMPGGKVVVYSGILPFAQDDNDLAAVLGHEIAHALANHGGAFMSRALLVELGGLTLDDAFSQNPKQTNSLFLARLRIERGGGHPAPLQQGPGVRGRSPGAHLHGHGRLRSARSCVLPGTDAPASTTSPLPSS